MRKNRARVRGLKVPDEERKHSQSPRQGPHPAWCSGGWRPLTVLVEQLMDGGFLRVE